MLDTQGWEGRRTMTSCGRRQLGRHPGSPLSGASVFSAKRKRMSAAREDVRGSGGGSHCLSAQEDPLRSVEG